MAQDIEKTRPDMIEVDAQGDKVVNYGKGFGAMLATMFEMDRDLKALEDSFKKRAKSSKGKSSDVKMEQAVPPTNTAGGAN
jgi:hypothetical protein